LASPKIRVKNNEKAKIHIGNRDPIVTTTIIAGTDQSTQNVQYVDSGIKLDIEPNVQLDGTVLAKISLEVSNATRLEAGRNESVGQAPVALQVTNAQTSLVLVDGVRTILGGLYEQNKSNSKTTFPFLGRIPIIGSLLSNFSTSETKREILLSITPYVVKRVEVPTPDIATIWSGGEDTLADGPKFGAFSRPLLSDVEATRPGAAPGLRPASARTTLRSGPPPAAVTVAEPADEQNGGGGADEVPAGPAMISIVAPPAVAAGAEFTVVVDIAAVQQLHSAPMFVRYDAARLEFVVAEEGTFLGQQGGETVFSVNPNPAAGQVVVGYKLAAASGGVAGSGTLFKLTFRAKMAGDARVELSRMNFRNDAGEHLEVAPAFAVIAVQ
jgi:general secretion pathway protein D